MKWTGWANSRRPPSAGAPEFQAKKILYNSFRVTVKIRTSGYPFVSRIPKGSLLEDRPIHAVNPSTTERG